MFLVLSQKIDYESEYDDIPFGIYHYPKSYRNQINTGDVFLYYQGDRHKRENRYYFGCGLIGDISASEDGEHYYAEIINGIKFANTVPIYNPSGGFYESIDHADVRQKERPAWQNSIRKISKRAFQTILYAANIDFELIKELLSLDPSTYIDDEERKVFNNLSNSLKEREIENLIENATDEDIEKLLKSLDSSGSIEVRNSLQKVRKVSRTTITSLKNLYNHTCQICAVNHSEKYGANVVEAHHIDYFSKSLNHKPNNIVILCPTHHRLVHAGKATFDRSRKTFTYENGYEECLKLNKHL